ncbi:MAG: T9SS type A sorting domain-containing protein [Ferruginibacter sp.]
MQTFFTRLVLGSFFILATWSANAQVTVTNPGNTTPGLTATYGSLAAAVTDLNLQTAISGPVIITLDPANPQTAPAGGYAITAILAGASAVNTVTFEGSANAITAASAPTVGSRTDAIIKIIGSDYITIQNFILRENPANTTGGAIAVQQMTEFGVALFAASSTDGAQNNTIQNNTITLSSATTYQNAIGIFSTTASSSTNGAQAAASIAGTNSNNKFYGNIISGVAHGFYFISPAQTATVFESGNDIGGSILATGNTITYGITNTAGDLGFTSYSGATPAGIYFRNVVGNSARYNTITSVSTLTLTSGGIFSANGTAPTGITYTTTFSNNNITITNPGTTVITGIDFGSGLTTGTIACNNNTIVINQNAIATVSAAVIGIKANYTAASSNVNTNNVTINQNFTIAATLTNSSAVTGITAPSGTTGAPTMNLLGNTITVNRATTVAATFTATMSGAITGIQATTSTTTMNIGSAGAGNNNTVTIKEAVGGGAGTTSYTSAVTYVDANATHATVNVVNNTLNTTGSTIRSTGTLKGINQDATVTVLVNIKNNTFNVDRVAATGTAYFQFTSGTPSEVADTVSNNNITFTSLSGSTAVTAINSGGGPGSPALNNKNINNNTISISGTHTGTSIGINCAFTNTGFIKSNTVTISSSASPTVQAITTSGSAMTISGNTLSLSSSTTSPTSMQGINETGSGAHSITNNTISAMNFTGIITAAPVISGIVCTGNTAAVISGNIISNFAIGAATSSANPVIDGILISGGTSISVYKNKIYGINSNCTGATGIISGIRLSGGTANTVYNNLVGSFTAPASTNPDAVRGINITSTTVTSTNNIYYNTVYLSGSGGVNFGGTGIFHTTSTTITTATLNLRNNIIVNNVTPNGTGLAVAYRRSSGIANTLANYASTSNNNLFYAGTPGASNLIYSDGTSTATTMAAYKSGVFTAGTIAPRDAVSVSENPPFLSLVGANPNFLHIDPTIATQVESGAATIGGITDDYDGDVRNVTTPDIGADEGTFTLADLTGPTITYTLLGNTSCLTDRTFTATITDASSVNTTAGTKPRLYYKRSTEGNAFGANTSAFSGWKYVEATNASSPFSFTTDYSILFGAPVAVGDIFQYFVVAADLATPTPNVGINTGTFGGATPTSVDLQGQGVTSIGGTPSSYTIITPGLSGTVTIGAAGTYTSITGVGGLFDNINFSGLSGNLTANILDASVTETGVFALNAINYNGCAAGPYTVLIKPNTTATLTGSVGTGSIIKINGSDYVTIDGSNSGGSDRSLTIQNTTTTTSGNAVIWLASPTTSGGATNNTIKNCIIEGNSSTTSFLGMYVGGSGTISLTSAGTDLNSNNTINNNLFRKTQYGLALFGYGAATPDLNNVISNNNFGTAVAGEGFALGGINADRQQNLVVSGNEIQNITYTGTGSVFGIRLLDFKNGQAYNNKVHDILYSGVSTPKLYGIGVTSSSYTTVGNPSNAQVFNNIVYKINSTGISAVWNTTGILASAGYGDKFYYNSVHLSGQVANSASGLAAAFANGDGNITTVCTNIDVRNNSFSLTGSSATAGGNFWAYYTAATTLAGSTINYNDLYCNGTGAANNVGRFNSVNYATLAAWQGGTGQSANGISADPLYNSTSNLVPQPGSPLVGFGVAGTGVLTDILGAVRSVGVAPAGPTIGAYENAADLVAPVILYTNLSGTCGTGDRILTATITDVSGVPTSGLLQPRIYYRKNAGAWFSQQGTLTGGSGINGTWDFTIVAADMGGVANPDIISYYVIAQDIAGSPNITSNPAAGLVATDVNTVTTPPTAPNTYTIQLVLSGTYTVGGAGTYTTLTAAINAYNTSCLGGAVVFELLDPTYTEAGAMTINANPDASAVNTLTIRPATGVTAAVSATVASGSVLKILDKYTTIDGSNNGTTSRNLTISNNSATSPGVLWIGSTGAVLITNVTVKNCIVINGANTASAVVVGDGAVSGNAGYFNNITIQNNSIQRAYIGIYSNAIVAPGNGSATIFTANDLNTAGANSIRLVGIYAQGIDGVTVSNNNISNIANANGESPKGIFLATGTNSATVSGNSITNLSLTNTGAFALTGIYVNPGASATAITINNNTVSTLANSGTTAAFAGILTFSPNTNITNNTVSGLTQNAAIGFWGIVQSGAVNSNMTGNMVTGLTTATTGVPNGLNIQGASTGVNVFRNYVSNIKNTNTGGYSALGLTLSSSSTTANITVRNNMISDIAGYGWASQIQDNGYGIYISGGGGYNLYYNSVNLATNQTDPTGVPACLIISSSVVTAASIDLRDNIFSIPATVGTNRYAVLCNAANTVFSNIDYNDYYTSGTNLGYVGATNRTNLAAMIAGFGGNTNSLNVQPNFTTVTDLHLVSGTNCGLDGYGTPIAGITTDYDSQTRDATTPDMGADEFTSTYGPTLAGIAGAPTCENKTVSATGTTFATSNCSLIARVVPSGGDPVAGKINACVTLDATQQYFNAKPYVQRHFDFEPLVSNITTTSATITMYFTDVEFTAYNTNNPVWPQLPTVLGGANGDPNKANVKVTQYHGAATTTPSQPGMYTGNSGLGVVFNAPLVNWNGTFWEVTVSITGFSGFYVHTNIYNAPLPVTVNYFTGQKQGSNHLLNWKVTCNSSPRATMTLERSADGRNYTGINTITADAIRCQQPFDYTDISPLKGMNYYRLKMLDADGKVTYSTTVALLNAVKGFEIISIAPNPVVSDQFNLNVASAKADKLELQIFDMQGRLVNRQTISVIAGFSSTPVMVNQLASGTYNIRCMAGDEPSRLIRFVKQ